MLKTPLARRSPSGFTLLELVVVLALMSLGFSVLLPAARSQRDRMAVLGAREEVAGLLHRTRGEALARGGAELILNSLPPTAEIVANDDTLAAARLEKEYGVTLHLSRGRASTSLAFGPMGLGRVSSQTLRFRRGDEEALLVVSSLGRVVRR
jgi:prepilin-type N-terminal cleavage/methylation domain-containing protein